MNKKQLHHTWTWFRHIKPWYFLILAIIFAAIAVVALRDNNQKMAELRQAVYAADKDGGDVQTALNNLQAFVTAHMNTSLSTGNASVYPPIQLQHTYERLIQAETQKLQSGNGDLYTQAQNYCQAQNSTDFSGRNRVPCIEQYVQQHGSGNTSFKEVPASLYQFDFLAPKWSPDLAGYSIAATIVFLLLAVVTFVAGWRIKRLVR